MAFFLAHFLYVFNMKSLNLITIVHPCASHILSHKLLQDCIVQRLLPRHCNPSRTTSSAPASKHRLLLCCQHHWQYKGCLSFFCQCQIFFRKMEAWFAPGTTIMMLCSGHGGGAYQAAVQDQVCQPSQDSQQAAFPGWYNPFPGWYNLFPGYCVVAQFLVG